MSLDVFHPADAAGLASLQDLSILITGGASGLGESMTRFLAEHGAIITIADLKDGFALVAELTEQGRKVQYVRCDILDYASQIAAFESAIAFSGDRKGIDTVLAFAGLDDAGPLVDYVASSDPSFPPPPPSVASIDVNLKGTFYTTTLALHHLRSSSSTNKSLTIVSSMAAYCDDTHNTAYTASKSGLRGLLHAVRADAHTKMGIRINAVAPWAMRTPMTAPILSHLSTLGIEASEQPGSGITLVPHAILTDAVGRLVVDEALWGRSVAILPEGAVDLGDDLEGGYAGDMVVGAMQRARERGDFLHR